MDKLKVENIDFQTVFDKAKDESRRITQFYELAEPIITKYQDYCHHYAYYDFNDLILKSGEILKQKPEFQESITTTMIICWSMSSRMQIRSKFSS